MASLEKTGIIDRITEFGERAVIGTPIEILEVELRGAGKARLLRVYIDKPGGVSHGDCELISQRLGSLLDENDVISGDSYTLEVSSPGVERKLSKPRDFDRVIGRKIKLVLDPPLDERTRVEGRLNELAKGVLEIETGPGVLLHVPLEQVRKANLKFEW